MRRSQCSTPSTAVKVQELPGPLPVGGADAPPPPQGAYVYGLCLSGLALPWFLESVPASVRSAWHPVTIERQAPTARPPAPRAHSPLAPGERGGQRFTVGPQAATVELGHGRLLTLERAQARATFSGPPITDDRLAHPYLGPVGMVMGRWAGREAFHAGAFVAAGRAWVLLGPRGAGKSTLLALLAARGHPVLADDLVITDGQVVFAGPRCIELDTVPPGVRSGASRPRGASRWRMPVEHRTSHAPLGGWILLAWDAALRLSPISSHQLLGDLARSRLRRELPSDPTGLMALASHPAWALGRPMTFEDAPRVLQAIERAVSQDRGPAPRDSHGVRHPT